MKLLGRAEDDCIFCGAPTLPMKTLRAIPRDYLKIKVKIHGLVIF
jgi:hypothetical protein